MQFCRFCRLYAVCRFLIKNAVLKCRLNFLYNEYINILYICYTNYKLRYGAVEIFLNISNIDNDFIRAYNININNTNWVNYNEFN